MTRPELNAASIVDAELLQPLTQRLLAKRSELLPDAEHTLLSLEIAAIKARMFARVAAFKAEHRIFAM